MAEYQKVEYQIANNGKVTETVINGNGETCTLATKDLEKSIGRIETRQLLPEYYDGDNNFLVNEQSQTNNNQ